MKGHLTGDVITIGVDLAKSMFQVHGVDAAGAVFVRRQLRRRQVLPFLESVCCSAGSHTGQDLRVAAFLAGNVWNTPLDQRQ